MWGSNIIAYYWNILHCALACASFFSFWYQEPYFSSHRSMDVVTGPTACARFKAGFESFGGWERLSCRYFLPLRYLMCRVLSLLSSTNRSCWTYGPVLSREDSPYSKNFDRSWTSSRTRKDKVSSILRLFIYDPKSSPFEEGWVEIEDEEGSEEGESAQPSKREGPRLYWQFGYGEKSPKGANF